MVKHEDVQKRELAYWASAPYEPTGSWYYYDREFFKFLGDFDKVADVGCGPVPYFLNHNIRYKEAIAVDPLISEYMKIKKYKDYKTWRKFSTVQNIESVNDGWADAVFALNVVDHVKEIAPFMLDLHRICDGNGKLFFYTDVGKKPDAMHPHNIDVNQMIEWLDDKFYTIYVNVRHSWKFPNDILYFVGEKK